MAVKFIRLRGRIIPIISDAVKKGSGYFGRASKLKNHEESIKALQAVRKSVSGKAKHIHDGGIETDAVFSFKNKVVKFVNDRYGSGFKLDLRHAAENALSRHGLAPKTHLIQTRKKSYLVQDKVRKSADSIYEDMAKNLPPMQNHKASGAIQDQIDKTKYLAEKKIGLSRIDSHWGNFGFNGNKAKILDAGGASFNSWFGKSGLGKNSKATRYANEYRALLAARSKVIKAKT